MEIPKLPYLGSTGPNIQLQNTHTSRIQFWNTTNYNYEIVIAAEKNIQKADFSIEIGRLFHK
jgi:hypothetical protein